MTETVTAETKLKMEFGAGKHSKRRNRRSALLWRLHDARRAAGAVLAQIKRDAKVKLRLNLENKPLGA